jgi:sorbitol/mannitol transport system permease protein
MATRQTAATARVLVAPSVIVLFIWMIVPLVMTIYFSTLNYNLQNAEAARFIGLQNYIDFLADPDFLGALANTLIIVAAVLVISVVGGIFVALLMDQQIYGQNIVRVLVIAPFFVMPTVSALIWKNMLMNPVSGLFAWVAHLFGLPAVDWFTDYPMFAVILIVAWQWLPFASLILLTALQSLDEEQKEAATLDGASAVSYFFYIVVPHIARAVTVVILIETIFLLNVFAEIRVTTNGGPSTTNIPFRVFELAVNANDVGAAAAGGIVAVVLANVVAVFLVRLIGKNLEA